MITEEKGFNVICINPEKAERIEPCWYTYLQWTEEEAMADFCAAEGLERTEVSIDTED